MQTPEAVAYDRAARLTRSEQSLLSGIMKPDADRDMVFKSLSPSDFYHDAHQKVATAIRDLWAEHHPVDLVTICDRLSKSGLMVGLRPSPEQAFEWVAELYTTHAAFGLVEYHSREVRDAAKVRKLMHVCTEILRDCRDSVGPAAEMIDHAAAKIFSIAEKGESASRLKTSAEATNEAIADYDRRLRGEVSPGIPTGLVDLDEMTGGLQQGQMCILAARPSVGKTALAHQIMRYAASKGHVGLFISLEQPTKDLADRAISATAGICGQILRMGKGMLGEESERVADAVDKLRGLNFFYDDTPSQSALQILGTARGIKRKGPLSLVVVDYLQLVAPDDSRSNRNDQIDGVTRRIREMARELNVAVLALSQLSRDCEKQNRRPRLSDLRDSGSLEQHADTVMILHRPEQSPGEIVPVELGIEKQRNGPTGLVNLAYRRKVLTFENSSRFPE